LRLLDIEEPLRKSIANYIGGVYRYIEAEPPKIEVLDDEQFAKKCILLFLPPSAYDVRKNVIYFRGRPTPKCVAHEIEHWAQAQRVGAERYLKQGRDRRIYLEYEKSADEVALANAPKLKW